MKSGSKERAPQNALRVGKAQDFGPAAAISKRAADRLRAGHLWVYRSDVEELVPAKDASEIAAGALVSVMDLRGMPLGTALYSASSQITLRMTSENAGLSRAAYLEDVRERVVAALALREELAPASTENNGCRLIFSEADGLPGIVADRYNGLVVLQLLTQGTAQDDVRDVLRSVLAEGLELETIVERPDARVRALEELGAPSPGPLLAKDIGAPVLATIFTINGIKFHFDAEAGQKTGAFLDQRLNYAAAATYGRGKSARCLHIPGGICAASGARV